MDATIIQILDDFNSIIRDTLLILIFIWVIRIRSEVERRGKE